MGAVGVVPRLFSLFLAPFRCFWRYALMIIYPLLVFPRV